MATPASAHPVAHLIDSQAVQTFDVLGPTVQILTPLDVADDAPCVMRGAIPPGGIVPLHSHADPETFLMLSGSLDGLAVSAEGLSWVPIGTGDIFHVPGGVKHAWRNALQEPAVTIIVSTARLGRFFCEVGTPVAGANATASPPSDDEVRRLLETSERYGYWNATPEQNAEVGLDLW